MGGRCRKVFRAVDDLTDGAHYATVKRAATAFKTHSSTILKYAKLERFEPFDFRGHILNVIEYPSRKAWQEEHKEAAERRRQSALASLRLAKQGQKAKAAKRAAERAAMLARELSEPDITNFKSLDHQATREGGAVFPQPFPVEILPSKVLGGVSARGGLLEAYLGGDAHPWKVRTKEEQVAYVAIDGLLYRTGQPVKVSDFIV